MSKYGYSKSTTLPFLEAVAKITELLKDEGFGVLTEIDVKATLKKKLDVDFKDYTILGVCNPTLAHMALQVEEEVGLLLPCNVILYGGGDGNTVVSVILPKQAMGMIENEELYKIADEAEPKLMAAIDKL